MNRNQLYRKLRFIDHNADRKTAEIVTLMLKSLNESDMVPLPDGNQWNTENIVAQRIYNNILEMIDTLETSETRHTRPMPYTRYHALRRGSTIMLDQARSALKDIKIYDSTLPILIRYTIFILLENRINEHYSKTILIMISITTVIISLSYLFHYYNQKNTIEEYMNIDKNNNILVLMKVSDPEEHIDENKISVNKLLSNTLLKHMGSNFLMRLGISSLSCISLYQIATATDPQSLFFLIVCFIVYKDFEKINNTVFNEKKFPNHYELTAIINILEEPTSLAELNFLRLSYRYFWLLKKCKLEYWSTKQYRS